tara:strand:- start:126 stop:374 length:249 start_codon:yes stop_codon:yes gene_type:complete
MKDFTIDESAYASYILGSSKKIKIKGQKEIAEATKNVLEASRALYVALVNEETTFDQVLPLLENKRARAKAYNKVTGRIWRL